MPERVGPDEDVHVPPMFFKIVVLSDPDPDVETPVVLAFLFAHQRVRHGEIEDFLVSVDVVEALTGLDFFVGLEEGVLEDRDTFENWVGFW
jgi:endonuclease G